MRIRGLAMWAMLCCALLLQACGAGSGRQGTDIAVTGSGPSAAVPGGGTAVFTMVVANVGPYTADDVTVTNLVGNQLALQSITCAAAGGATCPATTSVSMAVPDIPKGGSLTFTITTVLSAVASGSVSNTLTANYASDTDRGNNAATVAVDAVTSASNLVVGGNGPGGTVTGGSTAEFLMTVRNDGPDTARNLQFTDNVGNFLIIQPGGITCSASGGGTCPATLGVTMTLETLPAGATLSFTIRATVSQGVSGTVTNTLSVSADTDTARSDNSFTATASVLTPRTGVFATGTGPAGSVSGGGSAVFTMTVGNAGPDPAPSVSIVDNVGSNLTFTGISCSAAGGATCPATLGPVMTASNLPAGGTLVFSVTTLVAAGTSGTLTNTLTVAADNDNDRSDNTATAVATAATPRASLLLSGAGPAATVAGGDTATFTMTVMNSGPDTATGLRVTNTVGSNLTFAGASCSATAPAVCPAAAGVVTDVGSLAAGGKLTFSVRAVVAAGTNGAITNTIQASGDNVVAGGNSAVAVGQAATARSSLSLTGTGPSNVPSGGSAAFVFTLVNDGPNVADSVRLVNSVGGNLTLAGVACRSLTAGAVCPASTGPTTDVIGLPVGGRLEFTFTTQVQLGTQGSILDTLEATVTTGTRSQVSAVAVGSAYSNNLVVSGVAPPGPLAGSASATFTMTVANNGPGPALNVDLVNTLSAGLTPAGAITCTNAVGTQCPATPAATMTLATLPAGASLTFSVPVTVVAGTNGTVADTLSASAAGDTRVQDSTATATVQVLSPDLAVSLTGAPTVNAGSTAVFTAVVSNPTGAAATNLQLTSRLSATDSRVDLAGASIVCSASSGASCPATGPDMTVQSLPAGRTLTFTITLPVAAAARGSVTSSFALTVAGDPDTSNNQRSVTTAVVDARSGSYKAFAADGRAYDLAVDFEAGRYTMVGGGQTVQRSFVADAQGGYTVSANVRFRVATDLIAGGHDFGAGTSLPYVAVRSFGSSVSEVVGQYNLMTRDVAANGTALTHAAVMTVSGNQMLVCQPDSGTISAPGSTCPAGKQKNYVLTVDGGVYTATQAGGPEVFSFVLARSDASKIVLAALPPGSATGQLRLGLQDSPSLIGGSFAGASSSGAWVDTLTLSGSSYSAVGSGTDTATAALFAVPGTGVGAMLRGARNGDGTQVIWVMQSTPLAAAFGDATATGPAAGLFQIFLP